MVVLELFSGYECISSAFRNRGHECFTVDWDEKFPSNLHKDISKLELSDLPDKFRHPDVVFCGTDCTTYSVAAISKHRRKNPMTGNLDPISEKAKFADDMNRHVVDLIKQMNPKIQIWENPMGAFIKMDFVSDLILNTTTYCQYGFSYRKQTDFLSNIDLKLKEPCKNGSPCHEKAQRGARTGLQGIKDKALKSIYPPELCNHIANVCEYYIERNEKMAKVEEKKLIITLCEGYFIEVDELNHTLKQKYMGKDLKGNDKEQEKLIGYYPNVKSCVERVVRLLPIDFNNGEVISMQEYAELAEKAFQAVNELDL